MPVEDIADSRLRAARPRRRGHEHRARARRSSRAGQSLSGLLLPARGEIWVNAEEARAVAAAAALHDRPRARALGHAPHRPAGALLPPHDGRRARPSRPARDIEEEASAFAAALLMPQWLFVREHARCGGDVPTLCAAFGSSIAATERRIASLF